MLKISEAKVRLNTRVSHISPGIHRRWKLQTEATGFSQGHIEPEIDEYDVVIITAPFASNQIQLNSLPSIEALTSNVRPYAERQVTLFSTKHRLAPSYFNQAEGTTVPETILTAPNEDASATHCGIYSITVADRVSPPDSGDVIDERELVYKVISSELFSDDDIASLLELPQMQGTTQNTKSSSLSSQGVTWIHRQAWPHAYPEFGESQPLLDNIEIATDLFYTSDAEIVLSIM